MRSDAFLIARRARGGKDGTAAGRGKPCRTFFGSLNRSGILPFLLFPLLSSRWHEEEEGNGYDERETEGDEDNGEPEGVVTAYVEDKGH